MVVTQALRRAVIVGTVLQVVLALLAHFSDWIALHALLFGGMLISATAGYLYAFDIARGFTAGCWGGLIVGGVCGLLGNAAAIVLGDSDPSRFPVDSLIFLFTGGVGGLFGQLAVHLQPARR
jgi:hypothetical protein